MFHRNIKISLGYYFRSTFLTLDDSVKDQVDLAVHLSGNECLKSS